MTIPFQASMSPASLRFLKILAVLGAIAVVFGLIWQPSVTWAALLIAGYLLTGFGLAGIVFVAISLHAELDGAPLSAASRRPCR